MFGPSKATRDAEFTAFVASAQQPLLRMAYALTGEAEAARDLVQEALTKTYVAWGRIRSDEAMAYTRRIIVNQRIDTWRKTRKETVTDTLPDTAVDSREGVADRRDTLVRALAALPEQQRKVVVLRHYADMSEAHVADTLGISRGAVKSAASRGLAALRQHASSTEEGLLR
ncbi:RNA polymerase sigma-E factor [Nostocoides australiense Ben110]|uniref:RNA polymerase sigma-E factor n=1 Tax=Nostocoides australiense Ben110 TaxID=1193182 RepID=W6JSV9_9MICO|nr:SigE family RNA polymerase sigma factor [Tetrasphaera australiensis]CCH72248.1 RNA polymerase sigma-E factor [Tetrasphaera australiensis Ben110]